MAAAVEQPISLSFRHTPPLHSHRRQGSYNSQRFATSTLPPIHSPGLSIDDPDPLRLNALSPQQTNQSLKSPPDDVNPTRGRSGSAKLHKNQARKGLLKGRSQELVAEEPPSDGSYTPISTDNEQSTRAVPSRSLSKDALMKKLGKLSVSRSERDNNSGIDLSLGLDENEKRSGLTIKSQTQSPETMHTFDFRRTHNRTFSNGSVGSFGQRNSFATVRSDLTAEDRTTDYGMDRPLRAATFDNSSSMSRPKMVVSNDSESPIKIIEPSRATTMSSTSSVTNRNRANTYDGASSVTASSVGSGDRRGKYKRARSTSGKNVKIMDEATRVAQIEAARKEYHEKQEAKERRYEEQERKTQEKKDRKLQKQQEKQRKKSDASVRSVRARTKSFGDKYNRLEEDDGNDRSDAASVPIASVPRKERQTSKEEKKLIKQSKSSKQQSTGKETSGIIRWCKTHILHL